MTSNQVNYLSQENDRARNNEQARNNLVMEGLKKREVDQRERQVNMGIASGVGKFFTDYQGNVMKGLSSVAALLG